MITDNLVRIVNAGGGVSIDASKFVTDNLVRIANASRDKNCTIIIRHSNKLVTDNIVRIANAGNGNIIFEFD